MSNISICWLIERTLLHATTPGQSRLGSDGNEEVFRIPQSYSITRAWLSNCLVSYAGHSFGGSYPSAEKQSVYSTATSDWEPNVVVVGALFV